MRSLILVSAILMLTACQGQNPFKRQSNPMKAYPNATENANRPYVPGQKPAKPAPGVGGQPAAPVEPPCFAPLKVEVAPDYGNSLLKFVEEIPASYDFKITVNGYPMDQLEVSKPDEASVVYISREDNTYLYRLSWTAPKGSSKDSGQSLKIGFKEDLPKGACAKSEKEIAFKIAIAKTPDAASISFVNFKEKIKFGDKFDFKVIVEDASGKTPTLQWEMAAVTKCLEDKMLDAKKFQFICSFDSNLLKNVDKLLNSGKESSFTLTFKTAQSAPTSQKIRVLFEKIATGAKK